MSITGVKKCVIRLAIFVMACSMLITNYNAKAAGKVKLNKTKVVLTVGKTIQLKVKNAPKSAKIKWSTSKKKIATVSKKGKVTGKKKGTAKIIANVKGKKYTCKVTVKAKKQSEKTTTETNSSVNLNPSVNNNNDNKTTEKNISTNDASDKEKETPQNEPKVTFQSVSARYDTVVIPRVELESDGSTTDMNIEFHRAENIARQSGVILSFSDGSTIEYDQYKTYTSVTGFEGGKVGSYKATLTVSYEGKSNSTTINVVVSDKSESDDFEYYTDGTYTIIGNYIGEDDSIEVPEELGGGEVIGGFALNPNSINNDSYVSISLPSTWRFFSDDAISYLCWTKSLKEVNVDKDNGWYSSEEGVLFNFDKTVLCCYPPNRDAKEYVIPDSVKELLQYAMTNSNNLEKVVISKNVENIIKYCGVITSQFTGASSLQEVLVEDGNAVYKSIDGVLYAYKKGTTVVDSIEYYPAAKKSESFNIPEGIRYVNGFDHNEYLKNIVIPSTLEKWGYYPLIGMKDVNVYFSYALEKIAMPVPVDGDDNTSDDMVVYEDNLDEIVSYIVSFVETGNGTIYVRDEKIKNKLEEELGWQNTWTISDNYEW